MSKWIKSAVFAVLLIGAGYFFGIILGRIYEAYELILSPSWELLNLLLWFLLALGIVAVVAGLVAALVRPVWVGIIFFFLAGTAILLSWQVTIKSGILVFVYLIAASFYATSIARELKERIKFSVQPIGRSQGTLLIALVLVACGSLYLGSASYIEQKGFSPPEAYIDMLMEQVEKGIEAQTPAKEIPTKEYRERIAEFKEGFRKNIDEFFENKIKPYEKYIPLAIAIGLFMPLVTITRLLGWVPTVFLSIIFPLLKVTGVVKVVSETRKVERLTLD